MSPSDLVSQRDVRWLDFGVPDGSEPGGRRPVLVIQGDHLNHSRWSTTVVAPLTTNVALEAVPGSVLLHAGAAGLVQDFVILLTALSTVDKSRLGHAVGILPLDAWMRVLAAIDRVLQRGTQGA